jgi:hypothetical protein
MPGANTELHSRPAGSVHPSSVTRIPAHGVGSRRPKRQIPPLYGDRREGSRGGARTQRASSLDRVSYLCASGSLREAIVSAQGPQERASGPLSRFWSVVASWSSFPSVPKQDRARCGRVGAVFGVGPAHDPSSPVSGRFDRRNWNRRQPRQRRWRRRGSRPLSRFTRRETSPSALSPAVPADSRWSQDPVAGAPAVRVARGTPTRDRVSTLRCLIETTGTTEPCRARLRRPVDTNHRSAANAAGSGPTRSRAPRFRRR